MLLLTSKGAAGVTGSGFIVLAATGDVHVDAIYALDEVDDLRQPELQPDL